LLWSDVVKRSDHRSCRGHAVTVGLPLSDAEVREINVTRRLTAGEKQA
jgi:hypothetical protein